MNLLIKIRQSLPKSNYLMLILISALLIRLIAVFVTGDPYLDFEWEKLVTNMSEGLGYTLYNWWPLQDGAVEAIKNNPFPTAFMPPLYAILLYLFQKLFAGTAYLMYTVGVLQAFLGTASCYLTYKIARFQFDENISLLSAGILAFFPLFVYASGQCSSVVLYVFLNLLVVYFLFKTIYKNINNIKNVFLAGLFSGLLILARSEFLLYLPFIFFWIFLKTKKDLIKPVIYILITIAVLSPWYVRNYMAFDQFLFSPQTAGGYNLWRGNHPGATADGEFGSGFNEIRLVIKNIPLTNTFEIEVDKMFKERVMHYVKNNVGQSMRLAVDKLFSFWIHDFNSSYPGVNNFAYWFPWIVVILYFARGILIKIKSWQEYSLFHIYFILHSMLVMAFFSVPRYRLFILPFISIIAASGFMEPVRFKIRMVRKVYE